jgi:hypothetical protein
MGLFCKFLPTWVVLHTPTLAPEGASCRTTATAQLVARARHVREQVQHQPGLSGRRGSDAHSTCWAGCRGLLKRQRRGDPPHAASENRGDPAAGSPQQDPPGPPRFCSGIHCKTQAMIQPQALRSPSQPASQPGPPAGAAAAMVVPWVAVLGSAALLTRKASALPSLDGFGTGWDSSGPAARCSVASSTDAEHSQKLRVSAMDVAPSTGVRHARTACPAS